MRWRTISLLALGSRATVSPREITSRDRTGRRPASLGGATGFQAQGLPLGMGIFESRTTSTRSSHPPSSSPQIKTDAATSGDPPMPFIRYFIRASSKADTVPRFLLNPELFEELRSSKGGANGLKRGAGYSGSPELHGAASRARSIPIRRWKDDRPELRIRFVELERHGEIFCRRIFHANDPAVLLHTPLRVYQKHRLADVHLHLHLQQAAMSVDDQRHRLFLMRFALDVFRDHRDFHLQHHALAAPAVHRIVGRSHDPPSSGLYAG